MMTPAPVASATGSFVVTDWEEIDNLSLYVQSWTVHYLYHHDEDSWVQIPSWALAGSFSAGTCWARARFSSTITANGWSTSTITTTAAISWLIVWKTIRILTGNALNVWKEVTVSDLLIVPWGTSTIYLSSWLPAAVANTDTFVVDTWRFYVSGAGTINTGSFKMYDPLLWTRTTLSNTWMPWLINNDCRLVATTSVDSFASGTTTSATSTTLANSAKSWATNQWRNYQIRIKAWTWIWQIRTIASNTWNTITVSSAWTTTPDTTSQYSIEWNDDYLYLIGNWAITMYRYSISANTWTWLSPTTARVAAPLAWMWANWVSKSWIDSWANESNIQDGRYIYSFRWGSSALDRFDIAGWTAWAWAWQAITYPWATETFSTGSSYWLYGRYIYIRKDATHRYFKYSLRWNYIEPVATNLYADWTAVAWDKLWLHVYKEWWIDKMLHLYSLRNSGTELHRLLII